MNKFDNKWIMYHELHHQHRNGMTPPQIASFMGLDSTSTREMQRDNNKYQLFSSK
jgi:IS30 family transposase